MTPRTLGEAANGGLTVRYSLANSGSVEAGEHRDRVLALADRLEAETLVVRSLVLRSAEAGGVEAVPASPLQQRLEELLAGAFAAPARNDRERQLGRLLVDEPEAGLARPEEPVPRGAVGGRAVHGDDAGRAGAPQGPHVPVDPPPLVLGEAPVVGVPEHVAEEAAVVDVD